MKRSVLAVLVLGLFGQTAQAEKPEVIYGWKHSLVGALGLTQVAFKDWQQGGEDALAWTLALEGQSVQDRPKTNWTTSSKFAFGQTKLGDQGTRKTDDKIDIETVFTYKIDVYVNPYAAATLKTQFARGYQYDKTGKRTATSAFLDPAYLTQSAGVGYQPVPKVKTRLGLALREVLTSDFPHYADDPETKDEIEKTKVEGGVESVTNAEWSLAQNLLLRSKLELFAPIGSMSDVVMRNDNTIAAKVSEYITVNLNVDLINDKTASSKMQVKEVLSLSLSYTFM